MLGNEMKLQHRILKWAVGVFGDVAKSRQERAARFIEEAVELVQAEGLPVSTVQSIVRRCYDRPAGDSHKELGAAGITLLALAENSGMDAGDAILCEWERIQAKPQDYWDKRHAAKVAAGTANVEEQSNE